VTFLGGFFGLELPAAHACGLASFWKLPGNPALTFANGRSALAALLASVRPPRLWLPSYICRSVAEAASATATPVSYFPVDESLQPDTSWLESGARPGEMVLAVDYFGRAPGREFLDFANERQDLLFVEDACQAVDTGAAPWGRWCLRSPRKLVGVPDGGFVVPADGIAEGGWSVLEPQMDVYRAACLRFEDEEERANGLWHEANQRREARETVSTRRMSRLSRELLARLDVAPIADRRRANYRTLAGVLGDTMFLRDANPAFVPLGFPVRLPAARRDHVRGALIAQGIFPALHWTDVPSAATFGAAHVLAAELLTLPCDQRYQPFEMERMARTLVEILNR